MLSLDDKPSNKEKKDLYYYLSSFLDHNKVSDMMEIVAYVVLAKETKEDNQSD